jgi:hypothetical protein
MRRFLLAPFVLFAFAPSVLLGACEATASPPPTQVPAAQREVTARVISLGRDIDELNQRYESLLKQNAAIEKLLGQLGFSVQMSADTVAQRVELMHRFERAEAARTAAYERLKGLLKTLATQHKTEMQVEVRAGQIVVRLAEAGLFDPKKGRLRAEATPLLWAVAEGLKECAGRRFEVIAVVPPLAAAEPPAAAATTGKARPKPRARGPALKPEEIWEAAARRAVEVARALAGAGIAAERLAGGARGPGPEAGGAGGRFIEILVLPTRDELPRVHGTEDAEATPPSPPEKTLSPPAPAPAGR